MTKLFVHIPQCPQQSQFRKVSRALKGAALAPLYWSAAHVYGVPGLYFQRYCSTFGARLSLNSRNRLPFNVRYHLLRGTLESTRYIECDFAWRRLTTRGAQHALLDVSSPRMFPLIVAAKHYAEKTYLLNPDVADLAKTIELVEAAHLSHCCDLSSVCLEEAQFDNESFDTVTSLSVLEHMTDDSAAVAKMWTLIRPGGQLILSMPCARDAAAEYHDIDPYGQQEGDGGWYFFQRYYNAELLQGRVFDVIGTPADYVVYGEKVPGLLQRNLQRKLSDPTYPYWQEPLMMGREWRRYSRINDLPGEGVIAMAFEKPLEATIGLR